MKRLIAAALFILHFASSHAEESPDRLVMRVTDEVMRIVRTDKQVRDGDLIVAASVVETLIAPRFDFPRLTAGVLSKAWLSASPAQQEQLAGGLRTMLIQTLAVALGSLTDERIVLDGSIVQPDGKTAIVRCKVLSPGDEPVGLEYELAKIGTDWKAYEMKIGGVSLTAMYREQFAPFVRSRGIDGLISALEKKNATAVRTSKAVPVAKAPAAPQPLAVPVASQPVPPAVLPAHVETPLPSPIAKADTPRRIAPPRQQDEPRPPTTKTGPCVYKPVMTDVDMANCR